MLAYWFEMNRVACTTDQNIMKNLQRWIWVIYTRCVRKVFDLRSYLRVGAILRNSDRGILRSRPYLIEPHASSVPIVTEMGVDRAKLYKVTRRANLYKVTCGAILYKVMSVQWSMFCSHHRSFVLVNVALKLGFYTSSLLSIAYFYS